MRGRRKSKSSDSRREEKRLKGIHQGGRKERERGEERQRKGDVRGAGGEKDWEHGKEAQRWGRKGPPPCCEPPKTTNKHKSSHTILSRTKADVPSRRSRTSAANPRLSPAHMLAPSIPPSVCPSVHPSLHLSLPPSTLGVIGSDRRGGVAETGLDPKTSKKKPAFIRNRDDRGAGSRSRGRGHGCSTIRVWLED